MSKQGNYNLVFDLADLGGRLGNYTVDEAGCWIWLGYLDKNGYGRVYDTVTRKHEWVHRASFRFHKGPIPDGHEIDHTCTVTRCMNPLHLDAVTKVEHAARTFRRLGKDRRHLLAARMRATGMTYREIAEAIDMCGEGSAAGAVRRAVEKGLIDPAEVPPNKFLSDAEREEIRELSAFGLSLLVLAQIYGVDSSQISRIKNGMTSGHSQRGVA